MTNMMFTVRRGRFVLLSALLALVLFSMAAASVARANFQFEQAGVSLSNLDGTFDRQAGSHPDLAVKFSLPLDTTTVHDGEAIPGPPEAVRSVDVDLPLGLVGDPTPFPTCSPTELANPGQAFPNCPVDAQIGVADLEIGGPSGPQPLRVGVYNIAHGPNVPARFGFFYLGTVAVIDARVRPGDYGISSGSFSISQAVAIQAVTLHLWGVPADPAHDFDRQPRGAPEVDGQQAVSTSQPRLPFLSLPTSCPGTPMSFTMRGDSWEHPGAFDTRVLSSDLDGTPFMIDGCERVGFDPSVNVQPLSHTADAPTGLNVDIDVPQAAAPDGLATAHVRKVAIAFPKGMSVSPSSAAGLGACTPTQIGLGTNDAPACPDSAKIGSVTIDTPLLPDPLHGDIILATQTDNPFRSLIAMYIAAKGPGFYLKLPGRVDLDQVTGQLTATFDNTPQLPFSHMRVSLQGGSQAPLATPPSCGNYTTRTEITSWASDNVVALDTPMAIDQGCDSPAFAPSFTAGMTNPLAGQDSPFVFTLTRADRTPYLSSIDAVLPAGMLARIGSVTQCGAGPAVTGACPANSAVGTVSTLAGPGAQPLALTGRVYLTGPYKDAPFGLSIAVPTAGQAGPFDLGVVVVRAGIYVDRTDAHVTVKSDPLPTIIQGIPLRLRQVSLSIDRPKFMFNPTSCKPSGVFGSFGALGGATSQQVALFKIGGCGDLDLRQKLALQFTGKRSTTDGTHPGITAKLTDVQGGANLARAEVKLPLSVALDPDNAQALCKPAQRAALACPKASIVGTATAVSVLPHPLSGPVYFVEGTRKSPSGRVIATLPKLWIPLSGDGVTIDVNADSNVDAIKRLVTTFRDIPDAPISQFSLKINGGKHGIIVVSGRPGTCDRDKTIDSRFTGQNGQVEVSTTQVKVDGCKPTVTKTKATSSAVTLRVANLGAGKLTLSGSGMISKASRTLKAADEASISARLTPKARATLKRHGTIRLTLTVGYRPRGGKVVNVKKLVTVRR
ncbi:hypothetical protein DSM104299_05520 [Baekduia alba]|uniref:hypothetical protein n=1 Tax=Baekduia alba TaxID=2997333 RepID=UPI0023410F30|nr:hypothetical protein [Baekduia alba]WCB96752.1 hypothetical protein DSM104299_05520 [Baekduia alba]